jgi:hypothetical protein
MHDSDPGTIEREDKERDMEFKSPSGFRHRLGPALRLALCAGALAVNAHAQVSAEQMKQQAKIASQQPFKLSVRPLSQGESIGQTIQILVTLHNAENQSVPAIETLRIQLEVTTPSGTKSTQTAEVKPGETSRTFQLAPSEAGLLALRVRAANDQLRGASNYVLVTPKRAAPLRAPAKQKPSALRTKDGFSPAFSRRREGTVRYWNSLLPVSASSFPSDSFAAASPPSTAPPAPASAAHLVLTLSNGQEVLADGIDAATIGAFYKEASGAPAPAQIRVWFTWKNGKLDHQPLVIEKGEFSGESHLVSQFPVEDRIQFVSASPHLGVLGPKEFTVRFVPPIRGIAVDGTKELSIVDVGNITAEFFDHNRLPINTDRQRDVYFLSTTTKVSAAPSPKKVNPGEPAALAELLPTGIGADDLKVFTAGLPAATLHVVVSGWLVLFLALGGGAIGGLLAFEAFRGSLAWRVFTGLVAGCLCVWAYVFGALSHSRSGILHNIFSVPFVAILGGYLGLRLVDALATKFLGPAGTAGST